MTVFAFATWHEILVKAVVPAEHWYIDASISPWPYVFAGIMLLGTGIMFKRHSSNAAYFSDSKNYVDVIVAAVNLVSRPQLFDSTIDDIRIITARQDDLTQLTDEDKAKIISVYLLQIILISKRFLSDKTKM
jgi:hypothetical protein